MRPPPSDAASPSPAPGVVEPARPHARGFRRRALRRPLGGAGPAARAARHRPAAGAGAPAPTSTPRRCPRLRGVPLDRGTAMALARPRATPPAAAGLAPGGFDPERLGIFWGSGMAGAATFEATCRTVYAERRRMRPTSVVTTMPNAPVAELVAAVRRPRRRPRLRLRLRLLGGGDRRGDAGDPRRLDRRRHRRRQRVDADARACSRAGRRCGCWRRSRASPATRRRWPACCRPFAAERNGFALGEAAAAFVLESPAHAARARRAGRGDARRLRDQLRRHATSPSPMRPGQARAMQAALADAGLAASDIGYVNAHGTATAAGDAAEAESLAARVRSARRAGELDQGDPRPPARRRRRGGAAGRRCARWPPRRVPPTRSTSRRPTRRSRSTWCAGETPRRRRPAARDVELVRLRRHERRAGRFPRLTRGADRPRYCSITSAPAGGVKRKRLGGDRRVGQERRRSAAASAGRSCRRSRAPRGPCP